MPLLPSPTLLPTLESTQPPVNRNLNSAYRPTASRQKSNPNLRSPPLDDSPSSFVIDLSDSPSQTTSVRRSASTRVSRLPPPTFGRGDSPRSNHLPSPLVDFQTDDVLNVHNGPPYHTPPQTAPISGPLAHIPLPSAFDLSAVPNGTGHVRNGSGTPICAGGYNPFAALGLDSWTRESWGRRKIALLSGITGQDGSYLTECAFSTLLPLTPLSLFRLPSLSRPPPLLLLISVADLPQYSSGKATPSTGSSAAPPPSTPPAYTTSTWTHTSRAPV